MDIVEALGAAEGMTCVVGAGGKKTTLRTLAPRVRRGVVTATVRIPIFDRWVERVAVTDDPVAAAADATDWPLGVVPEREREDRYLGYDRAVVDRLADHDGAVLVKADGARTRLFKAPDGREPQLPSRTDTVVPIAGVHAVGKPLTEEHVHRVERVAALTGLDPGDRIGPGDVAQVLASPDGGLKGVPEGATAVPLVNMVDDAGLERTAREVAAGIHERADVDRVVLAEMRAEEPLVAVL